MFFLKLFLRIEINFQLDIINKIILIVSTLLPKRKYFIFKGNVKLRDDNLNYFLNIFLKIYDKLSLFLMCYQLVKPITT